ncbi:DUF3237 domain-containing protein [Sphingomonas oligophenolica]|uniref:UPF0311 protein ABC974_00580 n=1 Tax=Sphingomonas oligophenolica TaxID=301154 RepID=A0ABU9XX34_9SPHN
MSGPPVPTLDFAFEACVLIGTPLDQAMVGGVRKRIVPIIGGQVSGERFSGEVLPGGADWQALRPDGVLEVLARYTVRADDGTIVSIVNSGYRRGPAEIIARLAAGEDVDPALYYFRTTPRFDVAAGSRYAWLGESVFVCSAARFSDRVMLRFFAVG